MEKHHVFDHDYQNSFFPNKLELRSLQDCKDYLVDITNNAFEAKYENQVLTFEDGTKYSIKIYLLNA